MTTTPSQPPSLSILPRGETQERKRGSDPCHMSTGTGEVKDRVAAAMKSLPDDLRSDLAALNNTNKDAFLHLLNDLGFQGVQPPCANEKEAESAMKNTDDANCNISAHTVSSTPPADLQTANTVSNGPIQTASTYVEPVQKPRSAQYMDWASKLKQNINTGITKLKFEQPAMIAGKKGVHVNVAEFEKRIEECEQLVVGRFVGKRLAFGFVKESLSRAWGTSNFETMLHGEHTFLFKFRDDTTRSKVLETGSIHIASRLFIIRPWTPSLEGENQILNSIPIWVTLRKVPLFMWNPEGLQKIASVIGIPLMLDKATEEKTRLYFARVCVEIDASSQLPKAIPIEINEKLLNVDVEYAWLPTKCTICKGFGHNNKSCPNSKATSQPIVQVWREKNKEEDEPAKNEGWIVASGRHSFVPKKTSQPMGTSAPSKPSNVAHTTNVESRQNLEQGQEVVADVTQQSATQNMEEPAIVVMEEENNTWLNQNKGNEKGQEIVAEPGCKLAGSGQGTPTINLGSEQTLEVGENSKKNNAGYSPNGIEAESTMQEPQCRTQTPQAEAVQKPPTTQPIADVHALMSLDAEAAAPQTQLIDTTKEQLLTEQQSLVAVVKEQYLKDFRDDCRDAGYSPNGIETAIQAADSDAEVAAEPGLSTPISNSEENPMQVVEVLRAIAGIGGLGKDPTTLMDYLTPQDVKAVHSTIDKIGKDALVAAIQTSLEEEAAKVGHNTSEEEREVTTIQPPTAYVPRRSSQSKKSNPKFRHIKNGS